MSITCCARAGSRPSQAPVMALPLLHKRELQCARRFVLPDEKWKSDFARRSGPPEPPDLRLAISTDCETHRGTGIRANQTGGKEDGPATSLMCIVERREPRAIQVSYLEAFHQTSSQMLRPVFKRAKNLVASRPLSRPIRRGGSIELDPRYAGRHRTLGTAQGGCAPPHRPRPL
jgi:hypothetical protein